MRLRMLPLQVVAIVGGDQRDIVPARQRNDLRVDLPLLIKSMVLKLQEEIVLAEDAA